MSGNIEEEVKRALDVLGGQLLALFDGNYTGFVSGFSKRVAPSVTEEKFEEARLLFSRVPLGLDAIDTERSGLAEDGRLQLVLKHTGRILCRMIKEDGKWKVDDIYWNLKYAPEDITDK